MKINTKGSTRIVIIFKNYAIKIPRFFKYNYFYGLIYSLLQGWLHNRNEYLWYKSKIYDFLCPIKLSLFFSFIVIMPLAEKISNEEYSKLDFNNYNFSFEKKIDSFGKLNNKILIIDYGN